MKFKRRKRILSHYDTFGEVAEQSTARVASSIPVLKKYLNGLQIIYIMVPGLYVGKCVVAFRNI